MCQRDKPGGKSVTARHSEPAYRKNSDHQDHHRPMENSSGSFVPQGENKCVNQNRNSSIQPVQHHRSVTIPDDIVYQYFMNKCVHQQDDQQTNRSAIPAKSPHAKSRSQKKHNEISNYHGPFLYPLFVYSFRARLYSAPGSPKNPGYWRKSRKHSDTVPRTAYTPESE